MAGSVVTAAQKLAARLEREGYDAATAKSVVDTVSSQSLDEARTVLTGLVGEKATEVKQYLASRAPKPAKLPSQREFKAHEPYNLPLGGVPSRQQTPDAPVKSPAFTSQDKADAIKDLDAALHRLDLGKVPDSPNRVACTCMGSRHGLLEMAPNCLNCGRIVCNKEGLGPCLTCGQPLVGSDVLETVYSILSEQRMSLASTMGRKALAAAGIDPSSKPDRRIFDNAAQAHDMLERLLGYQDSGAQRTRIIDQVGDFATPESGPSMWMTPQEQALQLRQQQRHLRRQEELRKAKTGRGRKVISIDIRGNKVYQTEEDVIDEDVDPDAAPDAELDASAGTGSSIDDHTDTYYDANKFTTGLVTPHYPTRNPKNDTHDIGRSNDDDANHANHEKAPLAVIYDSDQALMY